MLSFIAAVYNEENELEDLLGSVQPFVDVVFIVDDGSTDRTTEILEEYNYWAPIIGINFVYKSIEHTGLPETVKNEALKMVQDGSWVLMLDADERLSYDILTGIKAWVESGESQNWDYVYFKQIEIIDGNPVRSFEKCKLFKKEVIRFPLNNIHADDQFEGRGTYKEEWIVQHRKTTDKQVQREIEYLGTYERLYKEGKIDEGRLKWLQGLHHFVFPKG